MIFLTVGTQLPFERLVKAVDEWAGEHNTAPVFAQLGATEYRPQNMDYVTGLSPDEYQRKFNAAQLVVSHVGMGTIISGLSLGKPMILVPRKAALGEHRNDHQLATARQFAHFASIEIVEESAELGPKMNERLQYNQNYQQESLQVSEALTARLRQFVDEVKANVR